jgi:hypothetical protein
MRYHMCNHQWLMSMAFSDPLDPYGGAWGHRAMFWHLAMLLFLVVVIIKISIGRRPLPLYPIVAGSAGGYFGAKLAYSREKAHKCVVSGSIPGDSAAFCVQSHIPLASFQQSRQAVAAAGGEHRALCPRAGVLGHWVWTGECKARSQNMYISN